jgi:hypothetical protein
LADIGIQGSSFDRARDAVDFVTATIDSLAGVVENAIFSVNLVDGGERSGMFWTVRGANAILALRCCHLNGEFEDYWEESRAA